ncbi:MAG: LptE family protein [Phycisphaerales bacterium]|nr:LptE family protein [Phycisphaerales bacterium]
MRNPTTQFITLLVGALSSVMVGGCSYHSAGQGDAPGGYRWQSLYRQDVQSVAVEIFTSKDFHQGVEFKLTRAIAQQIEASTPYKVVSRDRADTILEGQLTSVHIDPISSDRHTSIPQEQLVTLRVNFIWKDLRTGKILAQRKGYEQATTYYPTLGEGEFVGEQQAVERLALGIVQELQADW